MRAIARLASAAAASLILYGCAQEVVTVEPEVGPRPAGRIVARPGRPGIVVAAPHGTSDPDTGDIAEELSRRTGFGLVVATGFVIDDGEDGRPARRYQVNRPFEGIPGRGPADEQATPAAQRVYAEYERRVLEAAGGRLGFYVEIDGNSGRDAAGRIEIATVGVDRGLAMQLKTLFELTRDAHLRIDREAPKLAVLVQPADVVSYAAVGAKRDGILRLPERALHVELPRAARYQFRETYTRILADFLVEAAVLRPLR